MGRANAGDKDAENLLRILTPVYKFRACRDNIPVASAALEVRGGIGYIEEWVTPRLVRDAQIGTIWEGTSNINALDVVQRAVGKSGGHKTLSAALKAKYEPSGALPGQYKGLLGATLDRVERFVEAVAQDPKHEKRSRLAAGALYHATTAALLAWEGATLGAEGGDARRLLLSRLVIEHRLAPQDPLSLGESGWEEEAINLLLDDAPVSLAKAAALVG
jgi:acyl-CoA dehydrogenase